MNLDVVIDQFSLVPKQIARLALAPKGEGMRMFKYQECACTPICHLRRQPLLV